MHQQGIHILVQDGTVVSMQDDCHVGKAIGILDNDSQTGTGLIGGSGFSAQEGDILGKGLLSRQVFVRGIQSIGDRTAIGSSYCQLIDLHLGCISELAIAVDFL